ncbi:MAG: CPBP family intramembrane metalloprotease [Tannerellaceae bacterium]|jgi:membrane protease YdiL (CAAX protease family)|nr:CPBP family intramembrane metalloprotease [Tannerellaceae bacterium]
MRLKGVFAGKTALFQLVLLFAFILAGSILSSFATFLGGRFLVYDLYQNPDALRFAQFFSSVLTFLAPSLLVAWLCSTNLYDYLFIKSFPNLRVVSLTFASMILLLPLITLAGAINKSIKLPAFLEALENWMISMEQTMAQMTELLFAGGGVATFFFNLFVIAIVAAITEEFFFRGILQRIAGKWFTNHHLIIWLVAFVFSAIHLQFYGFVPRLLMGAFFGYLVFWSKNIWIPILAHFFNNATAVIGMSNSKWKDNEFVTGDIPQSLWVHLAVTAAISIVVFYLCVKKLRKNFD